MIKRHNLTVLSVALIISLGIWITALMPKGDGNKLTGRAIELATGGWGYEVLVNDDVLIHQEFIPTGKGRKSFTSKIHAERAAAMVIERLKKGLSPSITAAEIENITETH